MIAHWPAPRWLRRWTALAVPMVRAASRFGRDRCSPSVVFKGAGNRAYLAIVGGFAAPLYLGARATFALGQFGGHAVGCLRTGDSFRIGTAPAGPRGTLTPPVLTHDWEIGVLYGPHGAPDFFDDADIADLFGQAYEVHYNSARTGVRLIGPKPRWARADGGEAGLHPLQHPRQCLCHRRDRLHRRHADHPGAGWPEPRRLRLPGRRRAGRAVEARPACAPATACASGVCRWPRPRVPRSTSAEGPVLRRVGEGDAAICYRLAGDSYLLMEFGPSGAGHRIEVARATRHGAAAGGGPCRHHRPRAWHPFAADPLRS